MPTFNYKGVGKGGNAVSGSLEAADRRQALLRLQRQGVQPLSIEAAGAASATADAGRRQPARGASADASAAMSVVGQGAQGTASGSATAATAQSAMLSGADADGEDLAIDTALFAGQGAKRRSVFARTGRGRALALPFLLKFRQLHGSGMPLGEVLQVMANRMNDPQLKTLSHELYQDLSEGRTLAAAVKGHPEVFEPTMSYLIEAGEATGNLVPILTNIIEHLQTKKALSKKIKASLAYPCLITTMALAVVGVFLFFLVPRIESMLDFMGGQMSFVTALMIGLAEFMLQKGPFLLGLLVLLVFVVLRWRRTARGRRRTDAWLLRIPLVRQLVYNAEICRVTNVLAILLGNGVNTTESLRLAENTLQNTILRERFAAARGSINDGSGFAAAFRRYGLLPDLDIDILNVGESTGSLVGSFAEVYSSHAEELTGRLAFVTNLISGLAIGFAFSLIFILTLSIVLSVMNVSQSMVS